jgi:radical SAM superfamily enzyme YgiQ (UPF0313 family)
MGGPHVTEEADEALGRNGGPRHADAVALGEADETWPQIVEDAVLGQLKEIYAPVDATGKERKPSLNPYPAIPWDKLDLSQFNLIPGLMHPLLKNFGKVGEHFESYRLNRGEAVRTAASSARSPDSSATLFGSARTKASSTNCSC